MDAAREKTKHNKIKSLISKSFFLKKIFIKVGIIASTTGPWNEWGSTASKDWIWAKEEKKKIKEVKIYFNSIISLSELTNINIEQLYKRIIKIWEVLTKKL